MLTPERQPDFLVRDLPEAVQVIFGVDISLERMINDGTKKQRPDQYD
jgi:hypothetical protein